MNPLPRLLATAAHVLDQVGELAPVMVTCNADQTLLPPLTLAPASLGMDIDAQTEIVHTVATAMGWPTNHLLDYQAWTATGKVDGVEVQAIAAPVRGSSSEPLVRTGEATTAEHAQLLRDLTDWAATVPTGIKALEVAEDLHHPDARFRARLVLPVGMAPSRVAELVLPVPDDGWSGYRGDGVLPTGHTLTISTGM